MSKGPDLYKVELVNKSDKEVAYASICKTIKGIKSRKLKIKKKGTYK